MQPPARRGPPVRWGESPPGTLSRAAARVRSWFGAPHPGATHPGLRPLPVALARSGLAAPYLAADSSGDHEAAARAATTAMERSAAAGEWWPADIWGHRALWHYEQAGQALEATRAARLIGDLRWAAGDSASARRYYAEAISEARDLGAEQEEGLAALGMGRAALDLSDVTTARRLGTIALELLERAEASPEDLRAARELRGEEKEVP
jgi:tetratricopeptide (TPR) repeat protein